ncbi:MAG TPA: aldo/keto reductase [Chloroflexia bacterium]|nr:aldo/keto reductase [Chloroflexia bacterium]
MQINSITATTELSNGVKMPWFGLGTMNTGKSDEEVANVVKTAARLNYRSFDTAKVYKNETGVGKGLKESGVPREELFVTTKLWNEDHGYDAALKAFDESLEKLQLDYLDLYLIHWPVPGHLESWKALEKLYKDGRVRAIGVSNFMVHHLEALFEIAEIRPMVNQYEFHPLLTQKDLLAYNKAHNIQVEGYYALRDSQDIPEIVEIGKKYGKSPAQVVLRWNLQSGVVAIPKSTREERLRENADIFDFELSAQDMATIDNLDSEKRRNPHPDEVAKR